MDTIEPCANMLPVKRVLTATGLITAVHQVKD